ncbi:MAG TPA: MBL fold metallo-hydrolase [Clostridiales bacterium]|nr:MBL fold metallo-hydrolase [Clostridiales bacterium]
MMKEMQKIDAQKDYRDERMQIINVGAFMGSDAYLLITKEKAALIDSGFSFCAQQMIENIEKELDGRNLDYVLLTHSHYDHASGSPYCKVHFPGVKTVAGAYAGKIFAKPSALAVMAEMNDSVAKDYGVDRYEDRLNELSVDQTVGEGDVIDLGSVTLEVIEAPGHTKCSIAFYIPEEKMLISCETMGVYAGEDLVAPCFLVGYEMSLRFIKRAQTMDIEKILVPHYGVMIAGQCKAFLKNALDCNESLYGLIVGDAREGKTVEEIIAHYQSVFYNAETKKIQPLQAFELNAKYLVPMVLKEAREKQQLPSEDL